MAMPDPSLPPEPGSPAARAAAATPFDNVHKRRTGLTRVVFATRHSLAGLRSAWEEPAFRLESASAVVLLPAACWLGRGWLEIAALAGTVWLVLMVELLNSAIESAVDRSGAEWHPLAKRAKDLGSAAVMFSLILCGGTWAAALLARINA